MRCAIQNRSVSPALLGALSAGLARRPPRAAPSSRRPSGELATITSALVPDADHDPSAAPDAHATLQAVFAKAATTTAFLNEGKANWRSKPATDKQLASLQRRIGHRFKDKTLLRLALVHASAAPVGNNTGLAWLGDAALNLLAAEQLLTAPGGLAAMGELTQRRQLLVSRVNCEARAQQMGLGAYIILGKSILALGPSASVLAEGFEAVLGAVYIDGGMRAVRKIATASMDPPAPKPAAKRTKPAAKAEPASGAAPKQEAAASGSKAPAAKPAAARKAAAKSKPPAAKAKAKAKPASPATPKPRKRQAATPATAPPAAPVPQLSV